MWDEGRGGGEPVPGEREDGPGAGGGDGEGGKERCSLSSPSALAGQAESFRINAGSRKTNRDRLQVSISSFPHPG